MYAVLMGVGRLLQNYPPGGRPNAELMFDPAKGFNHGALTLVARSRNASGISRGKELYIDRSVGNGARVTGPLDTYFASCEKNDTEVVTPKAKSKAEAAAPATEGTPPKQAAGGPAPAPKAAAAPKEPWRVELKDLGFAFSLSDKGKLMILNSNSNNKKIPKNLLIAEWCDGKVPRRYAIVSSRADRAAPELGLGPPRTCFRTV